MSSSARMADGSGTPSASTGTGPRPSTAPLATRIGVSAMLTAALAKRPANTPKSLPCNCGTTSTRGAATSAVMAFCSVKYCDHGCKALMPAEDAITNERRPYTLFNATAASFICDSSTPSITGVVITTASTEKPCCWAFSSAAVHSPSALTGAARQAQRSPPFKRAAVIWVFKSLAGMPSSLSRSLSVLRANNLPTFLVEGPIKRK